MSEIKAFWNIELSAECPKCQEDIDLIDSDLWDSGIEPAEHETEKTTNYKVCCQVCGKEFLVDFEY